MTRRPDVAVWFELPTANFDRAKAFYENLLSTTINVEDMGPMKLGIFSYAEPHISGCIIAGPGQTPSTNGPLVYLNVDGALDATIARVESLGGALLGPKVTLPGDMGAYAIVRDSEGNRVGLHAVN